MIIFLLNGPLNNDLYGYSMIEVSPAIFSCISFMQYVRFGGSFVSLSLSLRLTILGKWEDRFTVWVRASPAEAR